MKTAWQVLNGIEALNESLVVVILSAEQTLLWLNIQKLIHVFCVNEGNYDALVLLLVQSQSSLKARFANHAFVNRIKISRHSEFLNFLTKVEWDICYKMCLTSMLDNKV